MSSLPPAFFCAVNPRVCSSFFANFFREVSSRELIYFRSASLTAAPCVPLNTINNPKRVRAAGGLPRVLRLLKHSSFEAVYKKGKKIFSPHMTVFYLYRDPSPAAQNAALPQGAPGPNIGLTVGRALGGAVQRNRIKRRLRAASGSNLCQLGLDLPVDVVINAKKTVLQMEFEELQKEVADAFLRVRKSSGSRAR